jgi:Ser/Thr protein kinase RdoA (MazF antagonist)
MNPTSNQLLAIASQFQSREKIVTIEPYGNGNINQTFLVTLDSPQSERFILQSLNTQVFACPESVMSNMRAIAEHVEAQLKARLLPEDRPWQIVKIIPTLDNRDYWLDRDGSFWRAITFIDNSRGFDTIQNLKHAREIGYGLGMFHRSIDSLSVSKLADTLPGFHITPGYFHHYEQIVAQTQIKSNREVNYCLDFIRDRAKTLSVLEDAKNQGKLPLRPIHGDPKINNILIDNFTGKAIGAIDLDTVKPGLIHYDLGDCLRSGCNLLGEETEQWQMVNFDIELATAILQGYFAIAKNFLTENDYEYFYDGIRLLALELGLRFFTDYLAGNVYFKVKHPQHNLARALVQFKLTESIEAQQTAIANMIQNLRCNIISI